MIARYFTTARPMTRFARVEPMSEYDRKYTHTRCRDEVRARKSQKVEELAI